MNKKEMISEIKGIVIDIFTHGVFSLEGVFKTYNIEGFTCRLYESDNNYFSMDIFPLTIGNVSITIYSQRIIEFSVTDYPEMEEIYKVVKKVKNYFKKEKENIKKTCAEIEIKNLKESIKKRKEQIEILSNQNY